MWRATGNERIVRRTDGPKRPATQTRYGLMRLTRLRATCEVRRTADSPARRNGGQARREPGASPGNGGAWGGWRRNVWKCTLDNQGDLSGWWMPTSKATWIRSRGTK